MAEITFTIPNDKIQKVLNSMWTMHPVPISGLMNPDGSDRWTKTTWAKECIRRYICDTAYEYDKRQGMEDLNIIKDNEIAS